jgi:hypothetical protein
MTSNITNLGASTPSQDRGKSLRIPIEPTVGVDALIVTSMQGAVSGILSIEPLATNQFNGLDASSRPF